MGGGWVRTEEVEGRREQERRSEEEMEQERQEQGERLYPVVVPLAGEEAPLVTGLIKILPFS